jgi:hypothetical protein
MRKRGPLNAVSDPFLRGMAYAHPSDLTLKMYACSYPVVSTSFDRTGFTMHSLLRHFPCYVSSTAPQLCARLAPSMTGDLPTRMLLVIGRIATPTVHRR